jgi:hypothetical protein
MAFQIDEAFWIKEGKSVDSTFSTPAVLVTLIVKNIFVIAGIILFFFIIAGGLSIILNAGNPDKQKQGSKTLGSAVAGFLILFASFWIIRIIEALTNVQILGAS